MPHQIKFKTRLYKAVVKEALFAFLLKSLNSPRATKLSNQMKAFFHVTGKQQQQPRFDISRETLTLRENVWWNHISAKFIKDMEWKCAKRSLYPCSRRIMLLESLFTAFRGLFPDKAGHVTTWPRCKQTHVYWHVHNLGAWPGWCLINLMWGEFLRLVTNICIDFKHLKQFVSVNMYQRTCYTKRNANTATNKLICTKYCKEIRPTTNDMTRCKLEQVFTYILISLDQITLMSLLVPDITHTVLTSSVWHSFISNIHDNDRSQCTDQCTFFFTWGRGGGGIFFPWEYPFFLI